MTSHPHKGEGGVARRKRAAAPASHPSALTSAGSETKGDKKRRRIAREHAVDPCCRICRKPTELGAFQAGGRHPDNRAVLARMYPRGRPENDNRAPGKPRMSLMCWRCANNRHRKFEGDLDLAELHWRSGRYPQETYFAKEAES